MSEMMMDWQGQSTATTELLDEIIDNTQAIRKESDRSKLRSQLGHFFQEMESGCVTLSSDLVSSIELRIAEIDTLLSEQVSLIMQASSFKARESAWRGLHKLVHTAVTENTQVRMFNCNKRELLKDFKSASDFDQSVLFKAVYESEYGTFGGQPFSAFVGDFTFDNTAEDIQLLEHISHVAAAAHAPFFSASAPGMFGMNSFSEMPQPRDLSRLFDTTDYARWNSFRQSDDARYVGLTLPRVIGRLPYSSKTINAETFQFEERLQHGKPEDNYLWVNAAYELAGRLVEAFEEYGWCASIRGVEGGGLVRSLPAHSFTAESGERQLQCPTEVAISDRREKELADLGFIPLVHCKNTDFAAFFAVSSVNKPRKYLSDAANANARLSSQLPYILTTSRFAHYLKVIVRDKVGSFMSRDECQDYLQSWIDQYVLASDSASAEFKARKPLREARVEVQEIAGAPGVYRAIAHLKPHYQLEGLTLSLRLVAELPASAS